MCPSYIKKRFLLSLLVSVPLYSDILFYYNTAILPSILSYKKDMPLAIIRIEFNDYQFRDDASAWHNKIFGTTEGDLNHYYNEISYGHFQFKEAIETDGTQDGIITVHLNEDHPGNVNDFSDRIVSAAQLADQYINYASYDKNKDGVISKDELQLMFLVAGGESATGANPGIWAWNWCMYGGNSDAPTLDNVLIMDCAGGGNYSRFGEKHFDADTGENATIGIIAHELAHAVFSLPDLYDTDGSSEGIGYFGLMGGGSWGYQPGENPGATPVHMTGWSKVQSHFITPVTIGTTQNLQLHATSSGQYKLYKIPTPVENEYFLIENRAALGYDRGLYSINRGEGDFLGGVAILHIDENQSDNNDEAHKLVDIEEANDPVLDDSTAKGDYQNLFYAGNQSDFDENTAPNSNTYNGVQSGVSISNISDRGDIMTLDITKN